MSLETLESTALSDSFVDLAELICARESHSLTPLSRSLREWKPKDPTAFETPIELAQINIGHSLSAGRLAVQSAQFNVDGDNLIIARGVSLPDDSYLQYFFETFSGIYNTHAHVSCLRAARLEKEKHLRYQAIMQRAQQSEPVQELRVIDKRRVRSEDIESAG